ncbi:MAG: HEAT repeat domain-containing protein [Candidatus Eremiobacteraeota bacterium]|nr:HEAT repeat domain-containing protein [Candidatus Eremiobacteraeota bacterium]
MQKLKSPDRDKRIEGIKSLVATGSSQAVKPLIRVLVEDESPAVRQKAASALGEFRDSRAFEPLANAMNDKDSGVRRASVRMISLSGDLRAPRVLCSALQDEDMSVRTEVSGALKKMGRHAVEPLLVMMGHENPLVRYNAVRLLGKTRDPRPLDPLLEMLDDPDSNVRRAVIEALGDLDDPRAFEPLTRILIDGKDESRLSVAKVLGGYGDSRAADFLMMALDDKDIRVARAAATSLGNIGAEAAIPALYSKLMDRDSGLCQSAMESLISLGASATEFLLSKLGIEDRESREYIAGTLETMGEPLGMAINNFFEEKPGAVEKLFEIKDPRTSIPILSAISHGGAETREKALLLLGKFDSTQAVEILSSALSDTNTGVQRSAVIALGDIGKRSGLERIIRFISENPQSNASFEALKVIGEKGSAWAIRPIFEIYNKLKKSPLKREIRSTIEILVKKTNDISDKHINHFCPVCLRRFSTFAIKLSFFNKLKYCTCRICGGEKYIDNIREIVAVLDNHMGHFMIVEDDILYINWLLKKKPLDLDKVKIVDVSDGEIIEFVNTITNDPDRLKSKKSRMQIDEECKKILKKDTLKLLKKYFILI